MASHAATALLRDRGVYIPVGIYTYDSKTSTALEKLRQADVVFSVGAERINDNFYKAILFSLFTLWTVHKYGKLLVLFPQTIGPFHFRITRWLSKVVLNLCDVVFLRDRRSYREMQKLGVERPIIAETCDVAILQPTVSSMEAKRLLSEAVVLPEGRSLVSISAMRWTYIKAQGNSNYEEYKKTLANVADALIAEQNVYVLFIATNILAEGCREDDVATAEEIMSLMTYADSCTILDRVYAPSELKGLMGLCDLCIVTRMHACIFSTGSFTPTVSINYQFKLSEYMQRVGLGEYSIDIDKVTYSRLKEIVDRGWEQRDEMRKKLQYTIPMMKDELLREMDKLRVFLGQGKWPTLEI